MVAIPGTSNRDGCAPVEGETGLKLKLDSDSQRRGVLKDRALAVKRIWKLDEISTGDAAVGPQRLVLSDRALIVQNVEPIKLNP